MYQPLILYIRLKSYPGMSSRQCLCRFTFPLRLLWSNTLQVLRSPIGQQKESVRNDNIRRSFLCVRHHCKFFLTQGFAVILLVLSLDHVFQLYAKLFQYPEDISNVWIAFF